MAAAKETAKTIETFAADTQKTVAETMDKATKSLETVTTFGQDTMDAMLKSQNIAAKAAEELQAEVIAFSKRTVEETVAHAKDLASAKTLTEVIEKQAGFAKVALDGMIRQTTKMNELVVAATKDVMAPLTARATAAGELVKTQTA